MIEKLNEMWTALATYQHQADAGGHGESWAMMCSLKTEAAAWAAYDAARAAWAAWDADAADAAYDAHAWAAADAAYAAARAAAEIGSQS